MANGSLAASFYSITNLGFGFICPLDLSESPRIAEIVMGFILKNGDPIAILSIRGFDTVQGQINPKLRLL